MTLRLNGLTIAKQIAEERYGKCLSDSYINNKHKLLWQCKFNHRWSASLGNVKDKGNWCQICNINLLADNKRLKGLIIAQQIAQNHNGKCLSKKYKNNKTKILWRCQYGHTWKSTLDTVKNSKSWCPECAQTKRAKSQNVSYILRHWKTGEELACTASYEKAVVEHLNINKIDFHWQPRSFKMSDGRKYYPDLYLFSNKKWIEIKGYFRKDAEEKWKWFQNIKPNSELWDKTKLEEMGIL